MGFNKVQKTVLIISTITSYLGPFLISSVTIALPSIEKSLNLDSVQLSWVISAFLLSSAILLLPSGKLADSIGQVKVYRWGIAIFTLSTFLCGFSTNFTNLLIFRVIQGFGSAMTMATGTSLLVSQFPANQRGRVLGINVAAVYLGLSSGPFIGGLLTNFIGWRSIFLLSAPLGVITILLTFLWLKTEIKSSKVISVDFLGNLLYATVLFLFVYGASKLPKMEGVIMVLGSALLIPLFVYNQKRSKYPLISIELIKNNKLFTYSNIAALINYSGTFAMVFYLSLFLQKIHQLTPQAAGAILVAQPITQALLSPVTGYLSDKIEPRFMASSGMLINAIGLLMMAFMNQDTSIHFIVFNLFLMGLGFALFSSPNMNTIMGSVSKNQLGTASGMASTMRVIGQMISMSIAALLFSIFFNKTPVAIVNQDLFVHAMKNGMIIMGVLCIVGIYFSHFRGISNDMAK